MVAVWRCHLRTNKGVACCWATTGPRITPRLNGGALTQGIHMVEQGRSGDREDDGVTVADDEAPAVGLRGSSGWCRAGPRPAFDGTLDDVCGKNCCPSRTIGYFYSTTSIALISVSDIDRDVAGRKGCWLGPKRDSPSPS